MMDDHHRCQSQQQQQQRQRCHDWCRFLLDLVLFYTTAFFVLLAIFSLFALVFLVPFFIDPAWSTLQADFDPVGTQCRTLSGQYLEGRSVCDWSSCQEGCTKTVYTCWKIIVEYDLPGVNPGQAVVRPPTSRGKLFPNVKGCGYPPNVDCNNFLKSYGTSGTNFTCFVSRLDPELVIVDLDLQQVKAHLFYSLAVPFPCLFVALFYLFVAYKFIYSDRQAKDAYRPVASSAAAAAGSAFAAAFIDLRDSTSEIASSSAATDQDTDPERQRKFLLQIQRTKWMAAHGKLSKTAPTIDLAKTVKMQELEFQKQAEENEKAKVASHMERMKKDRNEYNTEKLRVMHYYQYYNVNG